MASDSELLAQYTRDGSQKAFGELVGRHIDLVYLSARRQVGNAALAEDVTQAVFLMLSRKATSLRADVILPGWLMTATWYACKNAMRKERRRRIHEMGAASMKRETCVEEPTSDPQEITRVLDEALAKLGDKDRGAVSMRFLQGRSFREVAVAMGMSEEAANKRVARALEKLRAIFHRGGVTMEAEALAGALSRQTAQLAPATLSAAVLARVHTGATASAASAAAAIAEAAAKAMTAAAKAKLLARIAATVVIVAVGVTTITVVLRQPAVNNNATAAATPATAATAPAVSGALEALRRASAAVNNRDGETFKSLIAISSPDERAFIDLVGERFRLAGLFESTYRKTFGPSAPEPLSAAWRRPDVPASTSVFITGDHARILLPDGTVRIVKVDGQWKLMVSSIGFGGGGQWDVSPPFQEQVRRENLAYAEMTEAIAQGRFTSAEQARTELRNRLARAQTAATTKATTHPTVQKSPSLRQTSDEASNGA